MFYPDRDKSRAEFTPYLIFVGKIKEKRPLFPDHKTFTLFTLSTGL